MLFPPDELRAVPFRLRGMTREDWPIEQALSRVPDVVRWTRYPPDLTDAEAQERAAQRQAAALEGRSRRYVITEAGRPLGTAGLAIRPNGETEVFYALLPQARGRGAATLAATALTEWALEHGKDRVVLITIPGNHASEAVAGRAGFRPDGHETRSRHGTEAMLLRWLRTSP